MNPEEHYESPEALRWAEEEEAWLDRFDRDLQAEMPRIRAMPIKDLSLCDLLLLAHRLIRGGDAEEALDYIYYAWRHARARMP